MLQTMRQLVARSTRGRPGWSCLTGPVTPQSMSKYMHLDQSVSQRQPPYMLQVNCMRPTWIGRLAPTQSPTVPPSVLHSVMCHALKAASLTNQQRPTSIPAHHPPSSDVEYMLPCCLACTASRAHASAPHKPQKMAASFSMWTAHGHNGAPPQSLLCSTPQRPAAAHMAAAGGNHTCCLLQHSRIACAMPVRCPYGPCVHMYHANITANTAQVK